MENQKPFSTAYVLQTTVKHMKKSVDISIRKTFERIEEFSGDLTKSQEVFNTLGALHSMRKQLDNLDLTNTGENKNG